MNAAIFEFEWAGGESPILLPGETADINAYVTLTSDKTPPVSDDEMGFFLFVLTQFNVKYPQSQVIEPIAYGHPLEQDYIYADIPFPPFDGLTGTEILYDAGNAPGPILDVNNTNGERFLVSTVTLRALPPKMCQEEVTIFVADPSSDLFMYRGDLITAVPVTHEGQVLTVTVVCPEPASLMLLATGGLAVLRRR